MSHTNQKTTATGLKEQRMRRVRINRIKFGLILFVAVWMCVCMALNIILMVRVSSLQGQVDILAEKMLQQATSGEHPQVVNPNRKLDEETTADTEIDKDVNKNIDKNIDEDISDDETAGVPELDDASREAAHTQVRECLAPTDNLRASGDPMTVYLTFDDGPSEHTEEILEILKRHGVKATFFAIGKEGDTATERYRRIAAEGHTLGMHSYSHQYGALYESVDTFAEDFDRLRNRIQEATGEHCWVYRFPGGSSNQVSAVDMNEFIDYLGERGMTYYDWNVVCGDATSQIYTADEMVQNVMTDVVKYKYSVVLLHDAADKDTTVEALETILQKLEAMDANILPLTKDSPVIHHTLD